MPEQSCWVSVHVFYHGDLDRLAVHAVAPLLDAQPDTFFLRYWDGGPHLRVRVRTTTDHRPAVCALIERGVTAYLADHPSTASVSAADYRAMAGALAAREHVAARFDALCPDNSLRFIPYEPEHDRYGTGATLAAAERHFVESSAIALDLLTRNATAEQRMSAALAAILLAWFVGIADPPALAARLGADPTAAAPNTTVLGLAARMHRLAAAAPSHAGAGTLLDWARSVHRLRAALAAEPDALPRNALLASGRVRPVDGPDTATLAVLDICAHLFCNRIGVGPAAETTARRTAARAVLALAEEAGHRRGA